MTGKWAATNTLRDCERRHWADDLRTPDRRAIAKDFDAAVALVEAALDAAAALTDSWGNAHDPVYPDDRTYANGGNFVSLSHLQDLAAALRAVREGQ